MWFPFQETLSVAPRFPIVVTKGNSPGEHAGRRVDKGKAPSWGSNNGIGMSPAAQHNRWEKVENFAFSLLCDLRRP